MSITASKRLLNVLIFLGVIALLFVVGYPQYKESLPSKIKIGVDKSYASVPFYVAKEDTSRQYFVIENIEAELIDIQGDPLQGMKDGLYDIAAVPWYWLMISPSLDGDTLKACGSIELKSGISLDAIIIPENSRIKRLRDLTGKRLGYLIQDEYIVNLILSKMEEEGITRVTKVPLGLDEFDSAFDDNKVDAIYLIDPYRGYLLYQGYQMLLEGVVSYYIVPSMPYAAIVMRKDFVEEENRLAAIRIKNAVEAALGYISRNPEVAKRYIVKIHDWPSDGALTLKMRTPEYQRLAEVNLRNVEIFQTELVRRGIGTCGIKPSEFLFVRTDFVR